MNNRFAFLSRSFGLLVFIAYISCNASLSYAYPVEKKCDVVRNLFDYSLNGISSEYLAFTLRNGDKSFYILMLSSGKPVLKENEKGANVPWRLLKLKQFSDPFTYCLIAAGDRMIFLASLHRLTAKKSYGMPGSGHPRCSGYNIGAIERMEVRLWANKELGESTVYYLNSEIGEKNFVFLASHDQHWVFIEDSKNSTGEACYFDRGDNMILHDMIQKNND